jgi:Tfp pilus assembly protein PilV
MTSTRYGLLSRYPLHRRGFIATTTALTLMALITVALTGVVAATVADTRRTRQLEIDAQYRQLLLAGAADAAAHARAWGDAPAAESWDLALPESLAERGYHVRLLLTSAGTPTNADVIRVRIEANGPTMSRVQTMQFNQTAGRWVPSRAAPNFVE